MSTHVLRAWQRRYGLLKPSRSEATYRLYSAEDERRVRAMLVLRQSGIPAAQAARRVRESERLLARRTAEAAPDPARLEASHDHVRRLIAAVEAFDEDSVGATLDAALAELTLEEWIPAVVLPLLRDLGDRWAAGTTSVAHEHFASQLVRARLAPHTAGWAAGTGPLAVLACPPGERHDLALLAFGVLLGRQGWRVRFFGADTPLPGLTAVCRAVEPDLVVLAATRPTPLTTQARAIRRLATRWRVAVAGPGATPDAVAAVGALPLPAELVLATRTAMSLLTESPDAS